MRLPRLTTRGLMRIVAVAGVLIGIGIGIARLVHISRQGAREAQWHAHREEFEREWAKTFGEWATQDRKLMKLLRRQRADAMVESIQAAAMARISPEAMEVSQESEARERLLDSLIESTERRADESRRRVERLLFEAVNSAAKRSKYERAARYPWLPIPPDPPPPE